MEWLVIAVIAAIIIIIGACLAVRRFRLKKNASKAPFKKTYATTNVKASHTETASAERDEVSIQPKKSSSKTEKQVPQGLSTPPAPASTPLGSPPLKSSEIKKSPAAPLISVAASSQLKLSPLKSAEPATVTAQLSEADEKSQLKPVEGASETTAVDVKPAENKTEENPSNDKHQFITEIESEPTSMESEASQPLEKGSEISNKAQSRKSEQDKETNKRIKMEVKEVNPDPVNKTDPEKSKKQSSQPTPVNVEGLKKENEVDSPIPATSEATPQTEAPRSEPEAVAVTKDASAESAKTTKSVSPEKVIDILSEGKLEDWLALAEAALSQDHFQMVIHKIVKATYSKRKEAKMHACFRIHAERYIKEFELPTPPDSTSEYIYKCLAIVMQEDKEYAKAIDLCRKAIELELHDGTKTGYPGRIERLKKAQESQK